MAEDVSTVTLFLDGVAAHFNARLKAQLSVQPSNASTPTPLEWAQGPTQGKTRCPFAQVRLTLDLTLDELATGSLTIKLADKKQDAAITLVVPYAQLARRHLLPEADWAIPWQQHHVRSSVSPAPSPDSLPPGPAHALSLELRDKKDRARGTIFLLAHAQGVAPVLAALKSDQASSRLDAYRSLKELALVARTPGPNAQTIATYLSGQLVAAFRSRIVALLPPLPKVENPKGHAKDKERSKKAKESKPTEDGKEKRTNDKKEKIGEKSSPKKGKEDENAKRREHNKKTGRTLAPEAAEEASLIVETLQALTQVDVPLRGRLVAAGLIPVLLEAASCGVLNLELGFLECLKPFFTFTTHQAALAEAGALAQLISLVASDATATLQLKALEILLYFDEGYQRNMITEGLLTRLITILQDEDSGAALQTKALEVVQFFDQRYQEQILSPALLTQLASLLDAHVAPGIASSDKFAGSLVLKLLSVIGRFDGAHQKRLVGQGLLIPLVALLKSSQPRIRAKTLDVLRNLDASHRDSLIKAHFLDAVPSLLADEIPEIQLSALSTLGLFKDHLAQLMAAGLVKAISQALPGSPDPLALRMFEILETLEAPADHLIASGLHLSLGPLLAKISLFQPALRATKRLVDPKYFDLFFQTGLFRALVDRATQPTQTDVCLESLAVVKQFADARPVDAFDRHLLGVSLLTRLGALRDGAHGLLVEREILKLLVAHKTSLGRRDFLQFQRSRVLTRILKPLRGLHVNVDFASLVLELLNYLAASGNLLPLLEQVPVLEEEAAPQDARPIITWSPPSSPYSDDVIEAVSIGKDSSVRLSAPVRVMVRSRASLPQMGHWRWSIKVTIPADALASSDPFTINFGVISAKARGDEDLGESVNSAALVYNHSTKQTLFRQSNADQVYGKLSALASGDVISVSWDSNTGELSFAINSDELGLVGQVKEQDVFPAISVSGVRATFEMMPTALPQVTKRDEKFSVAKELRGWVYLGPSLNDLDLDWVLLYRASTHGWSSRTFHRLCDARGPTAVLSSLTSGYVFGGFTMESWAESYRSARTEFEEREFVFSITDGLGRAPQKLSPTLPVTYANPPTYSGPQFGASDLVFNLDTPTSSLGLAMQAYKQVPGSLQTWLAGSYTFWTFKDLEVWGLRAAQKRVLEDLLVLAIAPSNLVKDGVQAIIGRLQESLPRTGRLVIESLRAMIARGKRARAITLLQASQRKLQALPYEVVSINGFPLTALALPSGYDETDVDSDSTLKHADVLSLRRALDVDSLPSIKTDRGGTFVPRHGSVVHLVLEYKGEAGQEKGVEALPYLTHAIIRGGYDSWPARRAVIFTSNELPVLQSTHRAMARVTSRLYRRALLNGGNDPYSSDSDSDRDLGDEVLPTYVTDASSAPRKGNRKLYRSQVAADYDASSDEEKWSDDESVVAARARTPENEAEAKLRQEREAKEKAEREEKNKKSEELNKATEQDRLKATTPGLPELLGMGFEFPLALHAAQRHPTSLEAAIDDLVSRPDMLRQAVAAKAAAPPPKITAEAAKGAPAKRLRSRRTDNHARDAIPSRRPVTPERSAAYLSWLRALPRSAAPVALAHLRPNVPAEVRLVRSTQARYVHVLLVGLGGLEAVNAPSIAFLLLVGYTAQAAAPPSAPSLVATAPSLLPPSPSPILASSTPQPDEFLEVSASLGIMSSARYCRYDPVDQTTGILYYLGMRSGRNYWLNPLSLRGVNAHVELLTPSLVPGNPGNYQNLASFGNYSYDMDLRPKVNTDPVEFTFKFKETLLVTDLVVRAGRANFNQFTEWSVEGSSDGLTWETQYESQVPSPWRQWHQVFHISLAEQGRTKAATHFRFTFRSGPISLSGIEFYGLLSK